MKNLFFYQINFIPSQFLQKSIHFYMVYAHSDKYRHETIGNQRTSHQESIG
jgi:hypothetical protein